MFGKILVTKALKISQLVPFFTSKLTLNDLLKGCLQLLP